MPLNLVIVESAAKAKTIEKYLNSISELSHLGTFKVVASLGHIQDLPEKEVGIDTTSWTVNYVPLKTKNDVIKKLKAGAKEAKMVYLASDLDLEGNAIAFHLKHILKLKKPGYCRVIFNEITKTALKTAFLNPGDIDMNMFAAQETRRILDRIVGFELSPLLWRRFATQSLSAGRVQTAGLQMIVTRFKNADDHTPETYWTCEGNFKVGGIESLLSANVHSATKLMYWSTLNDGRVEFEKFLKGIISSANLPWQIECTQKKAIKNPSAPFTTSTFQQEVYNLYHIPPKSAMQSAQRLYEGGFITYMRTDSVQLSEDSQKIIEKFIKTTYGSSNAYPRIFKTKQANAQEAHEAIRPSDPNIRVDQLPEEFNANDRKIYSLIWRRTIASQMIGAEYMEVHYNIKIPAQEEYYFNGKVSYLMKEGYLLVYSPELKVDTAGLAMWKKHGDKATIIDFKGAPYITKAQVLYNESSIIKAFEKEGIGRPSTYAAIIDKLYSRQYIEKGECPQKEVKCIAYEWNNKMQVPGTYKNSEVILTSGGKERDFLIPTSLGVRVVGYLQPIVPFIVDPVFTSHMETDLDKIMNGTANKVTTLNNFYKIFHTAVEKAKNDAATIKAISATSNTSDGAPKKLYPKAESILHKYTDDILVVKTKYGPALLKVSESKWYSIKPFIDWKKKTFAEVGTDELRFIMSLPIKIATTERSLCIGPRGLYIKDTNGLNYILPEEHWENACKSRFDFEFINNLQPVKKQDQVKQPAKKQTPGKKKQVPP
jgi:DNA topoisomerase-1